MRSILKNIYILIMLCLPVCAGAAEAPGNAHKPSPMAAANDPAGKTPAGGAPAESCQDSRENPPQDVKTAAHPHETKKRRWGWDIDTELEKQAEYAARGPEWDYEPDFGKRRGARSAQPSGGDEAETADSASPELPPDALHDEYATVNPAMNPRRSAPPSTAEGGAEEAGTEEFAEFAEGGEGAAIEGGGPAGQGKNLRTADTPAAGSFPAPSEVESYRRRLEFRLLERYNNMPAHAGNVAKVTVVLAKPLQPSLDGSRLRAEFDQIVHDPWGKRIPELEKEYYVVTFGASGARQVRSNPSVRIGLNMERAYAEENAAPDTNFTELLRRLPAGHSFRANPSAEVPKAAMPDWWRPEFADEY